MTIGDVLAVIGVVLGIGASWTATILLVALLFPMRAAEARRSLVTGPGYCVTRGLAVFVVVGAIALALGRSHAGPVRLMAGALWSGLGVLAALGSAGTASLIAERIEAIGSPMAGFAALTRGTILYVTAWLLPVIGWFLVMPAAFLVALGAGTAGLSGGARAVDPPRAAPAGVAAEPAP